MGRLFWASVMLVSVLLMSHQVSADETPSPLNGIWHPVNAAMMGQELPKEVRDGIVLKLDGEQYSVTVNGTPDKGTFEIDRKSVPHRMTITGKVGPNQGKTLLAIFEMTKSETLRVCYDIKGLAFPAAFKSEPESTHYLVEYRRELPKGAELSGFVVDVPDSDAFDLVTADKKTYRIRLNGIDAPELDQSFGLKAQAALKELIHEQTVRVITQGEDRVGQIISDVYFHPKTTAATDAEIQLNSHLVENGLAWHFVRFAPDNELLATSEKQARTTKLGLWAEVDPISPWDWRRQKAETKKPGSK